MATHTQLRQSIIDDGIHALNAWCRGDTKALTQWENEHLFASGRRHIKETLQRLGRVLNDDSIRTMVTEAVDMPR